MVIIVEDPVKTDQQPAEPLFPVLLVAVELIHQRGFVNMSGISLIGFGYTRGNHPLCVVEAIELAQSLTGDYTGFTEFANAVTPDWGGRPNWVMYWSDYQGKDQAIEALERVAWFGK
jgi:hypothetical protein